MNSPGAAQIRRQLRLLLTENFDLEELRTLAFDLGVDFDNLRGEGKEAKARELVAYLERSGRLGELAEAIRESRPNLGPMPVSAVVPEPSKPKIAPREDQGYLPEQPDGFIDIYSEQSDWFNSPIEPWTETPGPCAKVETLYSNLLPVLDLPRFIYSAPIIHIPRLRPLEFSDKHTPFIIKAKRIWTFSNLKDPECRLRDISSVDDITRVEIRAWLEKEERRRWLVELLNQCLQIKCQSLGLLFDRRHKRFYFPPDANQERYVEYQATKRKARRRVAYPYRGSFWVHLAVQISFVSFGEQWYLKVEPGWVFTKDGKEFVDSKKAGAFTTRRKSREYNLQVFNHLIFWREYLGSGQRHIVIPCGDQQILVNKFYAAGRANFGILDKQVHLLKGESIEFALEDLMSEEDIDGTDEE